jgi:hypothetical protein
MKMLSIALMTLAIVSCSSTTDITKNPSTMTDFAVGQVYALKKPCWMRGKALLTLRGKEPADSEGILSAGTKLVVRKVVVERSPEVGTYTDVFAEVLTGEHSGKTVNVGVISKILKSGYAKRDPEMLEPVEGETK